MQNQNVILWPLGDLNKITDILFSSSASKSSKLQSELFAILWL